MSIPAIDRQKRRDFIKSLTDLDFNSVFIFVFTYIYI